MDFVSSSRINAAAICHSTLCLVLPIYYYVILEQLCCDADALLTKWLSLGFREGDGEFSESIIAFGNYLPMGFILIFVEVVFVKQKGLTKMAENIKIF